MTGRNVSPPFSGRGQPIGHRETLCGTLPAVQGPTTMCPGKRSSLGELRRHRERAELSRGELAHRVGYSRTYISTSEKPGADLVSQAVVTRIDQELGANGALIDVHARAAADRMVRRSPARAPISPSSGTEREELDQVKRGEFLQLAAGTTIAATIPRSLASLLADPLGGSDVNAWAIGVLDAVLNPTDQAGPWLDAPAIHAEPFRAEIDNAMTVSVTASYHALDTTLPRLIGRAEAQALANLEDDRAHRDLADVYAVAGWVLIKADLPLTAWIAAHRAVRAAERAHDPIRVAAATRCLAEVHMRSDNHEKAAHTALLATAALDAPATAKPADADLATSVRGAALLSAAAASARRGDRGEARAALAAAARCADRLGRDTVDLATVFGPTNARVEDRIRTGKAAGLDHLPSISMAINKAWCVAAMIATDLLRWFALLCLTPALADAEPKTLRYRLLPTAAHRRPDRPRSTQAEDQNPGKLALGFRPGDRVRARVRPHPHLTRATPARPRPEEHLPARGTGATDATVGHPTTTTTPQRRSSKEVKITNDNRSGRPTHPVNDQGQVEAAKAAYAMIQVRTLEVVQPRTQTLHPGQR